MRKFEDPGVTAVSGTDEVIDVETEESGPFREGPDT